jgi:hypothetical protein
VPAQIESFRNAMSRDSSLGIPFDKFFSICGNYDSVIYGRALSARKLRRDNAVMLAFPPKCFLSRKNAPAAGFPQDAMARALHTQVEVLSFHPVLEAELKA